MKTIIFVENDVGDGDAKDKSGNGNNGTVQGAQLTSDRFGNENSAYYFDGDGDYIYSSLSESLKIEGDVTLNVWMNHEDGDQYTSRIITTPGYVYGLWTDERDSGSRHYLVANGSGWGDGVGVGNYDNGTWRMVTLVASSESNSSNTNRNYRIYINGE